MDIEKLKKEIKELQKKVALLEGNCKRWRAEDEEARYYFITDRGVVTFEDDIRTQSDECRYNIGNYFQTKWEAEEVTEKIKIYTQLKDLALRLNKGENVDWESCDQAKYYIYYYKPNNMLTCGNGCACCHVGDIYCLDENFLNVAKQEIGEEKLIKLFE